MSGGNYDAANRSGDSVPFVPGGVPQSGAAAPQKYQRLNEPPMVNLQQVVGGADKESLQN